MSKENKEVHIAILEHKKWARFSRPEARCLWLGVPMDLEKALEVAGRYTELLPQLKENGSLVFIEEEGVKATKKLQCEICNDRLSERQDFEYLISKFPPETC
ncbi:hypothetical protein KAT60_01185 [Candidatus Woesebacteria bacterium]|nr:hypothetical protein [Candidatus Woesebacteria bacterium]